MSLTISQLASECLRTGGGTLASGNVVVWAYAGQGASWAGTIVHPEFDWRNSPDLRYRRELDGHEPTVAMRLIDREFAGQRPLAIEHRALPTIHVDRGSRAVVWCADNSRLPEIAAAYGLRFEVLFSHRTYFLEDRT